jgi:mono/diheme cytochrome c family protein
MIKKILIAIVAVAVVIQLVPYGHNHANPPATSDPTWNTPETKATFQRVCANCHSNETVWPWYSHVAPVSWLVQHDVDEGRANFNISERRVDDNGDHAARMVQKAKMPPGYYLWNHPEGRLSDAERTAFARGLDATFGGKHDGGGVGEKSGYNQ